MGIFSGLLALFMFAGRASGAASVTAARPANLRCEYLINPLGIHEATPRLSWIITSVARGQLQTAYQILVASSPEKLAGGQGDLWDTGKVASDQSAHVAYAGQALQSRQAAFWKVQIWDRAGEPSGFSAPAFWTQGLLKPEDWHAKWVAAEESTIVPRGQNALAVRHATYSAIDGGGSSDVTKSVADQIKNGKLDIEVTNDILGGDPAYARAKQLRVDYQYRGTISTVTLGEHDHLILPPSSSARVNYLRKSFVSDKPVRSATLYATALGLYEIHINGQRVGDHILAPDWTDYHKRLSSQAYDVAPLLKNGPNAIGALIANGWYAGHIGNGNFQQWGKAPALLAQLEISYADGSVQRISTDETWIVHASPLLSTDFMQGENYDARAEIPGWDQPNLDQSDWRPAQVIDQSTPPLCGQVDEPVRVTGEIKPVSLTEPAPGRYTFDLGQNMVGVVRLCISAPAGTKVTIRHAEMLNPDGTIYTANLRGAPSVDTYICQGRQIMMPDENAALNLPHEIARTMTVAMREPETWQPMFTFHGFRYVELTGLPAKPSLDAVTGIVLGTDTQRVGQFSCSDPRINQLQSNIQWGQRGNYLSVPTDCPQRDERLGWMGDAQVFVRTATKNADVAAFFTKWLDDVDDAQTPDGAFTDVSPRAGSSEGTPAWADAGIICPWTIYWAYDDRRLLEQHLSQMIKWIEWCRAHSTGLIRDKDRGGDYGDWLAIGANTPKDLIGTAYVAYSAHLVAQAAKVLAKDDIAAKYEKLFEDIKAAFNKRYVQADGRIQGDTQCCYALALKFDLLPENLRAKAAQYLEDDIKAKGMHLSTGFVGVSYLLPVLTRAGKIDTAYGLLLQDTFPSWLFSVKHGATTIWERWDGWTPEKGFQDPGMNSFNHYSLGSCGEWLYEYVAGIAPDIDHPGYKHTIIRPLPGGGLTFAKAVIGSIYGPIASDWKIDGRTFTLHVSIPPNTTATVNVPADPDSRITESGKPAETSDGVTFSHVEKSAAVYNIASGEYTFVCTSSPPLPLKK
jgi:alpha-L-rhamnosidase